MSHGRRTIMIVDDDPDFRQLLHMFLSVKGFDIEEAGTCAEALKIFDHTSENIDVVLLDYYMPGMTPLECVKNLKVHCGNKIPIILLTAAVDASLRAQELDLPHFVSKPFDVEKLIELLNVILSSDYYSGKNESFHRTASVD